MVTNRSRAYPNGLMWSVIPRIILLFCVKFSRSLITSVRINNVPIFSFWLRGQAVKTSPFHGGNTSSILVGVISIFLDSSAAEHPAVNRRVVGSNPTRGALFYSVWCGSQVVRPRSATPLSAGSNPARTSHKGSKHNSFEPF